jgi:NitT/TauT family transport system ATP-binding protein
MLTRLKPGDMYTMDKKYILYLEDIYKKYFVPQTNSDKTILNDIDFRVSGGEFITVVGPTGCGKSTLLRLILGSEKPTSGTILFNNIPIEEPSRDRGIVFQKYSLFPDKSVIDNVSFGLELEEFSLLGRWMRPFLSRRKRKIFREKAQSYLERVGLGSDIHKYPYELSGGMRQRVAIAQALIMQPSILLMDEPFGALDDSTRQEMQLFILEQWEKTKMTIFFVTHDLEEAIFLGTRIIVLSQYYSSDKSTEGAKIVTDISTSGGHPKPTNFKYTQEFNQILEKIRKEGLDPHHRQHLSEFNLSHPDSFRTL